MTNSIIRKTIQQANKGIFFPRSIRLDLLKNCQQTIPILAQWIYEEWHPYDALLTQEKLVERFKNRVNDNQVPFTIVALREEEPIGMISLKEKGEPEFLEFLDGSPWIGGFQVAAEERNQGLGQALLTVMQIIAARLGYEKILLYTSNPLNVEWYVKRGARLIERRPFRAHTISIMTLPCPLKEVLATLM